MHKLSVRRIPFSKDADNRLRMLKGRTGITPNILCRIGFCLSLDESGTPKLLTINNRNGREINRYTLSGEYDLIMTSLLVARLTNDGVPLNKLDDYFIAHMNRGVEIIVSRLKSLSGIANLSQAKP